MQDPGWKKVRSGIRDKHPGSATLRDTEITHDPLLFSVAQGNIFTVHRETLRQYIIFKRGGRGESVLLHPTHPD
jgi:hypothetical protein